MTVLQDFNYFQSNSPDYLKKSFAGNLVRYAPNGMAPLFALTSMSGDKTALSVEHGYFSKTMIFPSVTINNGGTAYDASTTTFVVDSSAQVLVGDLLRSEVSGEIMQITAIADSTHITVERSIGAIAAAGSTSVADNAVLYQIGNAFDQASNRPASRLMTPTRILNYTQIFRNSWAIPGTISAIEAIVGSGNVAESRSDCALFHAADIEKSIIFSQKSQATGPSGQWRTTMDGLVETTRLLAPAGNTTTAGATTTYTQLEAMLNGQFDVITDQRNGNDRIAFVGGSARSVINNIGRLNGTYQLMDGQTSFGLQFMTFKTSRGNFRMIEHPMLNSNDVWKKMMLSVDLPSIKLAYLPGRKQQNQEYGPKVDIPDSGQDSIGGTLTSELTMEILNPAANAVVYGLTAAAVG